jgi:hypothetical protein
MVVETEMDHATPKDHPSVCEDEEDEHNYIIVVLLSCDTKIDQRRQENARHNNKHCSKIVLLLPFFGRVIRRNTSAENKVDVIGLAQDACKQRQDISIAATHNSTCPYCRRKLKCIAQAGQDPRFCIESRAILDCRIIAANHNC